MKLSFSHHILLGLLATLTLRANAQSNPASGIELAAVSGDEGSDEDDWGAPSAKPTKKAAPAQAVPAPSESVQPVASPAAPQDSDQIPTTDSIDGDTEEAKPTPPKKVLPKKPTVKPAPVDNTVPAGAVTTPNAAPANPQAGAVQAPGATTVPAAAPNLQPQQAPQAPKPALTEPAVEAVPAPATKAPVVKNPAVKPGAVTSPVAPSNGAAQQTPPAANPTQPAAPRQVPAGVPLNPNTATNPNAAAVGNPMLPAKDIPAGDNTDELKGDPNTSTSANRARAKVKPSDVGLSTDQTSAILEIRKAAQNTIEKRLTEELKVAKQDLNTAMIDATPAEDVRKKFDLVQKKYLELQKIKFERTLKIREVLSVEQRKKLQGLKTSH